MNIYHLFRHALLAFAQGATLLALAGCTSGPDYVRPDFPIPSAYKEAGHWKTAQPQEADANQPWWSRYGDDDLSTLVAQAYAARQDIRTAEPQYRQARETAQLARSGFWPTLGAGATIGPARTRTAAGPVTADNNTLTLGASWEPDIWGRVQRSVEAGEAAAQASAADLAAVHLSIQVEMVQDYLQLRATDAQRDLLLQRVQEYRKALSLTRSQYNVGVASGVDVALAETQLQSTSAQAIDLGLQRAQVEHAIAILTGRAPTEASGGGWNTTELADAATPVSPTPTAAPAADN